jgi:hypothetical protein
MELLRWNCAEGMMRGWREVGERSGWMDEEKTVGVGDDVREGEGHVSKRCDGFYSLRTWRMVLQWSPKVPCKFVWESEEHAEVPSAVFNIRAVALTFCRRRVSALDPRQYSLNIPSQPEVSRVFPQYAITTKKCDANRSRIFTLNGRAPSDGVMGPPSQISTSMRFFDYIPTSHLP